MTEQEVIQDLQDQMVLRAERLVRELSLKKGDGAKSGKNQASRALEVAQSAGSLSVFINWLRYQAAREKKGDFWTKNIETKKDNQPDRYLAKEMTDDLVWLREQILNRLQNNPPVGAGLAPAPAAAPAAPAAAPAPDKEKANLDRVTMRATTRFLGYFRRALIGSDYLNDIMLN